MLLKYEKNDGKQENLSHTQSRKTKNTLDWDFNESDKDHVKILVDLEPGVEGASNLDPQFDKQVTNKIGEIDLSNQQEFEQIPEIRNSVTEVDRLKGVFS